MQLVGNRVRIIAQHIDARTGTHLWSEGYTRPCRDVLDLQIRIAREIARQLEVEIVPRGPRKPSEAPRVDSTAYALYLMRMGQFEAAESYLRDAARPDPASQLVLTALGLNDLYRGLHEPAKHRFRDALALQSDAGEARTVLGLAYFEQNSARKGLRVMQQAAESMPIPWPLAHLGWAYAQIGRPDSTRALLARIERRFDPAAILVAGLHASLGEKERAVELLRAEGPTRYYIKIHPFFDPLHGYPPSSSCWKRRASTRRRCVKPCRGSASR